VTPSEQISCGKIGFRCAARPKNDDESCIGINNSIGFQADVVVSDADIAVRDHHIV